MDQPNTIRAWQSKTLFLNGFMGLVMFVALFFPQVAGIGDWVKAHADVIGMVWAGVNMVLRLITKDKIVLRD